MICLHDLQTGQIVEATINRVEDYGAFVNVDDVDNVVALILVVDISWARVPDPRLLLNPGQRIRAKIRIISPDQSRVSLSMKALQPDPWLDIETKYPLQSVVTGRVASIVEYGVFVELEFGVEGLIHRPEPAQTEQSTGCGKITAIAQEVAVRILMIDPAKRRISLRAETVHV